ncbi:MAG: TonB-dependent receptor [Ignavibacteriae bacterium]|nr:TonB-dependent receptor [Ignavibacteriota bacterium]
MKKILYCLMYCSIVLSSLVGQELAIAERDTMYYLSPVIVNPIQAKERETPVTFSNLKQEQLKERYTVQDIPVLLSEMPSMTFYSENGSGIGYNYINLRGFDQRRLSVMINGIPQNDPEDHNVYWIDFPDLLASTSDIQIQRGAGSAFYGPPAIGGSINLVTTPFNEKKGIKLESLFGFQEFGGSETKLNTRKYEVSVNSGMIENQYALFAKLGKIRSEGYREHSWVDLNSYFLGAVRFDKDMTTRFHFFGGPLSDGLAYYGLPKFVNEDLQLRRVNLMSDLYKADTVTKDLSSIPRRRPQEVENFFQPHYELMNEWRLSPTYTLYNTLFFYTGEGSFDYDASWADTSALRIGSDWGIPATENPSNTLVRAYVENQQFGWLPRLEIEHENGTLTLGTELRIHRSVHWGKVQYAENLPFGYDPDYHFYEYNGEKDIVSLYAHELYRLDSNLTLMGDLQFVYNRYGIANEKFLNNSFSMPYSFVNPRIGINYNFHPEWNGYISLAYTSREPRLKNLYAAEDQWWSWQGPQFESDTTGGTMKYNFDKPLVKPERLFDVEVGVAYQTADAQVTANLFWMEFTDELVKNGQVDMFGQPVTGNAERTRHIGLEFDGVAKMNDEVSLSGNLTISQNNLVRFSTFKDASGNDLTVPFSLDGNSIAGFPDVLCNLRATYNYEGVTSSLVAKYVGSFFTDNFENGMNKNDEYTVINFEFLYQMPEVLGMEFNLRGEVRNLLNKLYLMSGEGDKFFPAAERSYLVGVTVNL